MKIFNGVTFDQEADSCYISISDSSIVDTLPKWKNIFVDVDKDNNIVWIEIINLWNKYNLVNKILFSDQDVALCV